jgi:hypothetical protein
MTHHDKIVTFPHYDFQNSIKERIFHLHPGESGASRESTHIVIYLFHPSTNPLVLLLEFTINIILLIWEKESEIIELPIPYGLKKPRSNIAEVS